MPSYTVTNPIHFFKNYGHLQPQCLSVVLMIKHYLFSLNQCHCCGFCPKKCLKECLTLLCSFNCRSLYRHITHMPYICLFWRGLFRILFRICQVISDESGRKSGSPISLPPTVGKSKHWKFISET